MKIVTIKGTLIYFPGILITVYENILGIDLIFPMII